MTVRIRNLRYADRKLVIGSFGAFEFNSDGDTFAPDEVGANVKGLDGFTVMPAREDEIPEPVKTVEEEPSWPDEPATDEPVGPFRMPSMVEFNFEPEPEELKEPESEKGQENVLPEFDPEVMTKEFLLSYALETFDVALDKRKNEKNLYNEIKKLESGE